MQQYMNDIQEIALMKGVFAKNAENEKINKKLLTQENGIDIIILYFALLEKDYRHEKKRF